MRGLYDRKARSQAFQGLLTLVNLPVFCKVFPPLTPNSDRRYDSYILALERKLARFDPNSHIIQNFQHLFNLARRLRQVQINNLTRQQLCEDAEIEALANQIANAHDANGQLLFPNVVTNVR